MSQTTTIYVVYGSDRHWSEFSAVFTSLDEAEGFAAELFGLDEYDCDAITDAYETGGWKAFSIDCHEIELTTPSNGASNQ